MSPERTRNSKNKPGMISTYPSRRSSSSRLAVEKIVLFGSPWGRCPVPCCFHSTPSTSLLLRKKVVLRFLFFSFSVCGRFFFFPTLFEHCTGLGCIMKVFFFFLIKKGKWLVQELNSLVLKTATTFSELLLQSQNPWQVTRNKKRN